jgi:4-hydroxy-2-oxoheptanedioate aldolase
VIFKSRGSYEPPENREIHPKFDKAVRTIIETARAKGIGAGIHYWGNIEQNIDWVRHGANMVLRHADVTLFAEALRNEVNHIRETLGDQSGSTGSQDAEYI